MTAYDVREIQAWTHRQLVVQAEYRKDPTALGDWLDRLCRNCRRDRHSQCPGSTHGFECGCAINRHLP